MLFRIDESDRNPLHQQIAACARGAIASGSLKQGDRLPPARELADALDVNMHTVLRAYAQLREEGLVDLRRGRGVTVRATRGGAELVKLARALKAQARRQGVSHDELVELLRTVS